MDWADFQNRRVPTDLFEEPKTFLDQIAQAGLTTSHIPADDSVALENAMKDILAQIPSCLIPLNPIPDRVELLAVNTIGGAAPWLDAFSSCAEAGLVAGDRGFVYTNGNFDEIELCGQSCADLKDAGSVEISQTCPPPP